MKNEQKRCDSLNKNLLGPGKRFFKFLEVYKPHYNYLKAGVGLAAITFCIVTPFTFNLITIPLLSMVCISQTPVNWDKLKEKKLGKLYTKLKIKLRW